MRVSESYSLLCSYKHKSLPKFQKKLFDLSNKSFFQIRFHHWFIFRQSKKLKDIRIFYYIFWFSNFISFQC